MLYRKIKKGDDMMEVREWLENSVRFDNPNRTEFISIDTPDRTRYTYSLIDTVDVHGWSVGASSDLDYSGVIPSDVLIDELMSKLNIGASINLHYNNKDITNRQKLSFLRMQAARSANYGFKLDVDVDQDQGRLNGYGYNPEPSYQKLMNDTYDADLDIFTVRVNGKVMNSFLTGPRAEEKIDDILWLVDVIKKGEEAGKRNNAIVTARSLFVEFPNLSDQRIANIVHELTTDEVSKLRRGEKIQ